jgi:nitrogen fixation/metabolism regulation signal transduction histidine kinase
MAIGKRLRKAFFTLLATFGVLLWLAALLLFSRITENSDDFSRLQEWILLVNILGIVLLVVLIAVNLVRLLRDYRNHVPGSRLRTRMVTLLVALAVIPLVAVYLFSVQFINRGIDSWFDVDVESGLSTAFELSQRALDLQRRENLEQLQRMAERLATVREVDMVSQLGALRRDSRAVGLVVFDASRQIPMFTSFENPQAAGPLALSEEVIFQLSQGPYVSLEPRADGAYQIVAAVTLSSSFPGGQPRILQAVFPVEERLSVLANAVQETHSQYGELSYLRTALKYSFTLTLSLVLLIAVLASVYGAFFSAHRLVVPIQQLMQGTRAVARGDFGTRLPTPPESDEISFLINSFNDMTQRLAKAHQEADNSRQMVERERGKLAVILARLTTGVVSLEADMRIRTANHAAGAILGVNLDAHVGESLVELATPHPLLGQFLAVSASHLERGETEWREQIVLKGEVGRRVLMCACTELPGEGDAPGGYVVVFDDITALLQAQKDAAWGEVARRLAHEIKNPLTPIQLSAERLRRRYIGSRSADPELLDRATHTIIQQVESMKEMVNAFSQYARTPDMDVTRFDLNTLIAEVTELYRHHEHPVKIELALDETLPAVEADQGRLRQVLHNLLRNALEALERQPDGRIEVATHRRGDDGADLVEIVVSDDGPGFVEEIMGQAFDPYVTSKPKGTGLGLAIVKKLVEEHGGQIRARNLEQRGAEISILLPITSETGIAHTGSYRRHDNRRERA